MKVLRRVGSGLAFGGLSLFALALCGGAAQAGLADIAAPWSHADGNWIEYTYNGSAIYDYVDASDPTKGVNVGTDITDITSGYNGVDLGGCNPVVGSGDETCGPLPSAYYYYYNEGNDADESNDVLFFRMRVKADPTSKSGFSSAHWNFLVDVIDLDGYKEFWVDVAGDASNDADILKLLYEDNDSNQFSVTSPGRVFDNGCEDTPRPGYIVDSFLACNSLSDPDCAVTGGDGSHTRMVTQTDIVNGISVNTYFVDAQVPVAAFRSCTGLVPDDTAGTLSANTLLTWDTSYKLTYSTSQSNSDPLQKDWTVSGLTADPPGDWGDVRSTPVTLGFVNSRLVGEGLDISWATFTEMGNAGFNLYGFDTGLGEVKLNAELIPSRLMSSIGRQDYSFAVNAAGLQNFWIEQVDINGSAESFGPFSIAKSYGDNGELEPVNWSEIASRHQEARELVYERRLGSWRKRGYPVVNLGVTESGVYRVSFEDLAAIGVDWSGAPEQHIGLTRGGVPVPMFVSAKGKFKPGDWVEFYGEPADSLYTDESVYQLRVGGADGLRISEDPKPPRKKAESEPFYLETVSIETENEYAFLAPNGDPWYDTRMCTRASGGQCNARSEPGQWDFEIPVDNLVVGAAPASLELEIWGIGNGTHHLTADFNGAVLPDADVQFDGTVAKWVSATIPQGGVLEGVNLITLGVPADATTLWDQIALDRYSLTYPRAFVARDGLLEFTSSGKQFGVSNMPEGEVVVYRQLGTRWARLREVDVVASGGAQTVVFAGEGKVARYIVAGGPALKAPAVEVAAIDDTIRTGRADLLVISHGDFIDGLQPLVDRRVSQGYSVKVVDVESVYSQFGDGSVDPWAIKRYVEFGAANMGTRYVLLVGGDTYDYKDFLGLGSMSFVPSLYAATGSVARFAPVDPLYTDIDGDSVPDLPIGRFPVRTASELELMITKTLEYEDKAYGADAVLAADLGFVGDAESVASKMPGWDIEREFLDDMPAAAAKELIKLEVANGTSLLGFIGHSGPTVWTYRGLFNASDAAALENVGKPTLVSQWGCWNTYYVDPYNETLAHKFLVSGLQGAAAVMGSTTVSYDGSERALADAMTPGLVQGATIGDALQAAKRKVAGAMPAAKDVILGWTILGDPTLPVVSP